ncbi:MipA/OmpV family protein [Telmatospirillum siberiense]|uniref:MipA/OmpV family protein n=1 Tax=Telmatospirillum siberiense TaxID=382514 RepID=UPI00237B19B7|nr:MipA/OmpV family protein [Telmatospirillum siberiense]
MVGSLSHPVLAQDTYRTGAQGSDWNYTIGGGAMVAPNYEGSKHDTVRPMPMLEASWRNAISLSTTEGLKVVMRPLPDKGFFVAGILGYWLGRQEGVDKHHGDTLRGLGNLSGGAVGKLETGYQFGPASFGLEVARDLGNDRDGTTLTPYASYKIYQSQSFRLSGKLSTTWADDNYMNNLFGITSVQSRNSLYHYTPYTAEAGMKDVKFGLMANYSITPSVSLFAMVDVARLLGDAADSPIVKTEGSKEQVSGGMGLTYRF